MPSTVKSRMLYPTREWTTGYHLRCIIMLVHACHLSKESHAQRSRCSSCNTMEASRFGSSNFNCCVSNQLAARTRGEGERGGGGGGGGGHCQGCHAGRWEHDCCSRRRPSRHKVPCMCSKLNLAFESQPPVKPLAWRSGPTRVPKAGFKPLIISWKLHGATHTSDTLSLCWPTMHGFHSRTGHVWGRPL